MLAVAYADSVFAFCRAGMEGDCCAELVDTAGALGVAGWCRKGGAWVEFFPTVDGGLARMADGLAFTRLVFTRQWFTVVGRLTGLPPDGRAGPLARAAAPAVDRWSHLWVEHPDSDACRPLARLARALHPPIRRGLADAGLIQHDLGPVIHVALTQGDSARVGIADAANSAPWPAGIPRLRVPQAAPSRSVLKLEEALHLFVSADEWSAWLRPGRSVVDLGAAPGGWTWFMAQRGLSVDAVDRARLAAVLAEHERVAHHRSDGLRYRPRGAVDWLLCDMVEQPHRIAALMGRWLEGGQCRHALFNLKLPMKRRWRHLAPHLATVRDALPSQGRLRAKQLYHDRDEVTVFATRNPLA